jgi:hypothetical protein
MVSATLVRESRRVAASNTFSSMTFKATSSTLPTYSTRFQSTQASVTVEETPIEHRGAATITDKEMEVRNFVRTADRNYEFFTNVEFTLEGVAVIRFDCPKKVNSISFALSEEAKELWKAEIENNPEVKAVVFSSAKPDMFIAGADIFDIKQVEDKNDLVGLIKEGIDFFKQMREKKVPLVCAINGPALGGGLEWAMWCDYRVCSNSAKTKVSEAGFPLYPLVSFENFVLPEFLV